MPRRRCADKAGRMLGLARPAAAGLAGGGILGSSGWRSCSARMAKPRRCAISATTSSHELHPDIRPACEAEQARVQACTGPYARVAGTATASAALLRLATPILARLQRRPRNARRPGRLRRPDPPQPWRCSVGWRRGLGQIQARWRHRPPVARRSAGHRQPSNGTVTDAADRAISSPARVHVAPIRCAPCLPSATPSNRSTRSRARRPQEFACSAGWHNRTAKRVRQAGQEWRAAVLDVSFRSTAPVLAAGRCGVRGTAAGGAQVCVARRPPAAIMPCRTGQAGSVDAVAAGAAT